MRRSVVLLASMALAVLLASGVALAAAGDLDPSFGEGGKTTLALPGQELRYRTGGAYAVAVHPQGGLVVVGNYAYGLEGFVARLKSDGSLDSTFGGGDGVVINDLGTGRYHDDYRGGMDVVVRPDGKSVVVGTEGYGVGLARYNPNGALDKSFGGGDGKVSTGRMAEDPTDILRASALLRQPDGKLVVAGVSADDPNEGGVPNEGFLLVRYHADGRRDMSFGGGDGIVITQTGAFDSGAARDLVRRSDGKLVVAGSTYRRGSQYDFALVRYNPNGTVDKNFGARGDGKVYIDYFGGYDFANGLVRYNGGVVAAGYAEGAEGGGFALARFTSDGRLDQRFGGGDGKVLSDGGGGASDLVVQDDGKLVAAGASTGDFANVDFALARYYPGGRLDDSFGGGDGQVLTDFGASDAVRGLALQPNGKIVAAGSSSEYYPDSDPGDGENDSYVLSGDAVARYLAE